MTDKIMEKLDQINFGLEQKSEAVEAKVEEKLTALETKHADEIKEIETKHAEEAEEQRKRIDTLESFVKRGGGNGGGEVEKKSVNRVWLEEKGMKVEEYTVEFKKFLSGEYTADAFTTVIQQKGLFTGNNSRGGIFVTPRMADMIEANMLEYGDMRALATVIQVDSKSIEVPVDFGHLEGGWDDELQSPSNNSDSVDFTKMVTMVVNNLTASPKVSQDLIDDAVMDIEAWLANKAARKFAQLENLAFVSGNGVKKPRGILTYDNGTNYEQIEQVVTGANNGVTYDGLSDIVAALKSSYQANATWVMHRKTLNLVRKLKDDEGMPIWANARDGDPATIFGKPVVINDSMPEPSTDALAIIYGDIRQAYMIIDRAGVTVDPDKYTDKPNVIYDFKKRLDGMVVNFEAVKIGKLSA